MRTLTGIGLSLLLAGGLFAQARGSAAPFVVGGPGNAVFPAGTPANNPFITRVPSNVVYPGGGGPHFVVPGTSGRVPPLKGAVPALNGTGYGYGYGYSIYVPYDSSYLADPNAAAAAAGAAASQQGQPAPNVVVIYPPAGAAPMGPPPDVAHPQMQVYNPDTGQPAAQSDEETPERYLLAFKDHSIYSVVAFWADGDTLHYFTSGNNHKQVPLTSLDRDLTQRLNQESGSDFKLPPAK